MTKLLLALTALLAGSASAFSCSSTPVVPLGSGCLGSRSVCAGAALAAKELRVQPEAIVMAVPKKRQSKMKTRQRKANVRAPPPNAHSPRTHTRNLVR